ncbi:hypothetical protein FZC79_18635 [Rossellomorea vietnamensis]|uniref:Dynamin N-terminal domain-containing protein n=1 Tax=Rossellomorea vietnamensis TaxID=218284 RepID=A0A5D4K9B6_9BACI|nr:GTPase [Rossellomorea vietnamensis]TYR73459.1 hypothetical protein FZC79_18635 [Rossellomorea vietnamensis]
MVTLHEHKNSLKNKRIKNLVAKKNKHVLKSRMKYHFGNLQDELQTTYSNINSHLHTDSARLVLPVLEELTALNFRLKELTEGLDKTFELFIVGMGNYGKSTLINALIEQSVADIDVRPKTWKVDVYDSTLRENQCTIIYRHGVTEYKSMEDTKLFIEDEEQKTKKSKKVVRAELKKVLSDLQTKEAIKETEDYLKKEFLYQSNVVEVRWPIDKKALSRNFMVVDTPGLVQENLSGDTIVSIQKYYHKADGVIWLLDATSLAAKKSKDMVTELEESLSKVGGKTDNIIAVINRIDLVRNKGGEEAEQHVLAEANKLFGKHFDNFICISAKQALEGILGNDKQKTGESGIETLIQAINSHFYVNAQKIQLQSREVSYKQILHEVTDDNYSIKAYLTRLREEQQQYRERKETITNKYSSIQKNFKTKLNDIANTFLQSAENRINNHAQALFDLESDYERENYIKDYLFCLDELQLELESYLEYWTREIEELMKQLVTEVVFTEYKFIDPSAINKRFNDADGITRGSFSYKINSASLETDNLSFASGAGIAAIGGLIFGPVGLLLAGLTSVLGINRGLAKLFKSGGVKKELNKAINDHVKDIKNSITRDLNGNKNKAQEIVTNNLKNSFSSLHGPYESSLEVEKSLSKLYEKIERPIVYPSIKTLLLYDKKMMNI